MIETTEDIKTAEDLEGILTEALTAYCEQELGGAPDACLTYEESGMLTRDRGCVVQIGSSEFQITIVQSRR